MHEFSINILRKDTISHVYSPKSVLKKKKKPTTTCTSRNVDHACKYFIGFHHPFEGAKHTWVGSQRSSWEGRKPSWVEAFPDRDEQIRWNRHVCSDVLVDQGLMFQFHPLRWGKWSSNPCQSPTMHAFIQASRSQTWKERDRKSNQNMRKEIEKENNSLERGLAMKGELLTCL